jgi:pSer/pThr/pTyr-binding forkhead associated (FHA) protein
VEGPAKGNRIELTGDQLVLGRGEDGVGTLGSDPELSRRHASISRRDGHLVVEDLGSTNGTVVNGRRISEPTPTAPGDSIEVGMTTLRVLKPAPEAGRRAPQAAGAPLDLEIVDGAAAGTRVPVEDKPVVFGRAEDGVRNLGQDRDLSRRHASVSVLDGRRLLLEDLGSTNGTFINSQRIWAPTVAQLGDSITLGGTTLKVVARNGGGGGGDAPTAESELSPAGGPGA